MYEYGGKGDVGDEGMEEMEIEMKIDMEMEDIVKE